MDDDLGRLFARSGLEADADPAVPICGFPVATRCHRVGKGEEAFAVAVPRPQTIP